MFKFRDSIKLNDIEDNENLKKDRNNLNQWRWKIEMMNTDLNNVIKEEKECLKFIKDNFKNEVSANEEDHIREYFEYKKLEIKNEYLNR